MQQTVPPETSSVAQVQRLLGLAILAIGVGALATVYIAQFGFGYDPCELCLYQRVPYAFLIAIGAGVWFAPPRWRRGLLLAAALAFTVGAVIAGYHVGVEKHWWASAVCGGETGTVTSPDQLMAALTKRQETPCDRVNWTLLGVSMATWNAAFSALMAATLFTLVPQLKERDGAGR